MRLLQRILLPFLLAALLVLGSCTESGPVTGESSAPETTAPSATKSPETETAPAETEETEPEKEKAPEPQRRVTAYFANWYAYDGKGAGDGEVAGIPWDKVTAVNHSFWKVAPAAGESVSSVERRASGKGPRSEFKLVPCDEHADFHNSEPSEFLDGVTKSHFDQYPIMAEKYPEVNVMLSVGGWSDSGFFSEMAYTEEGRASFIKSCMEVLSEYPWLDGIDLDWEFNAGGSSGKDRKSSGSSDDGCPVWGTAQEDRDNFTALCREMREAFDAKYGKDVIPITAAASGSAKYILPNQDWVSPAQYLTRINVMTYDMTGSYDGATGHVASLTHVKEAYEYLTGLGIPASKLYMGTQLYGKAFYVTGDEFPEKTIGVSCSKKPPSSGGESIRQLHLKRFELDAVSGYYTKVENGRVVMDGRFDYGGKGWHYDYDAEQGAAYMYNDDPDSEYYRWWISYESALSLQDKLDFMEEHGILGMIVWASNLDTADYEKMTQIRYGPGGR